MANVRLATVTQNSALQTRRPLLKSFGTDCSCPRSPAQKAMNGYFKSECGKTRADPGSTRWVHNKFLRTQTKLRWVCGLCNVWCKDENGYKCHLEHENHIRKSANSRQSKAREFKMSPRDEAFATSFVQFLALSPGRLSASFLLFCACTQLLLRTS